MLGLTDLSGGVPREIDIESSTRDGNRIYAFGHPFLSLGVSEFPMHEGEVVTVMSSDATSFKISVPTAMVGTLRGDRSSGIYGELGVAPRMIPIEVNLKTSRGENRKYQFDVVADRFLTPILMPIIKQAGIDPVYFGVLFIINNAIGLITPPVGVVLNVVCDVSRVSMEDIIKGVWPFMIVQFVVLFLMVLFPSVVTLPAKWFGG